MSTGQAASTSPASAFQVGAHLVLLSCCGGRWTVTVDTVPAEKWHMSQAAAWEAGVREADRLDRLGTRLGH